MTDDRITFEILWYSGGPGHAPNRVIARDRIKRHDLTAAIRAACRMLASGKGSHDGYAHGFYVRSVRANHVYTLDLPPVPEWDGEPNELQLTPKEGAR